MTTYTLEPANFKDYRDFLKARFKTLKEKDSKFSINSCAKKSGISKSLLQFIFNKKRHVGLDRMPGLTKALKLSAEEEHFVYLLICRNSSKSPHIQNHFEKILDRLRHQYVLSDLKAPEASTKNEKSLYENYLFMMFQTLVRLNGFNESPAWILKNLKVPNLTEKKIVETIQELEKVGYLTRDENGMLSGKKNPFWRPDPLDPTGQRVYTRAAEAVAELMQEPSLYRPSVYMSMSLGMDEENLSKAEKLMIDVHHQLSQFAAASTNATALVQVGNFMLTVCRLKKT